MAKGYWIARVDVTDPAAYQGYIDNNGPALARYGGRFLVRGGRSDCVEGGAAQRNVVVEFPDYESALACWRSAEYQHARSFRLNAADFNLLVIEGYDGRQPGD